MPWKTTKERAQRARRAGKAPTTQAGEFVREEMEHAKRGKHPVKSRKQAIAIGLSKARRSGVKIPRKGSSASKSSKAGKTSGRRRSAAKGRKSGRTKAAR